MLCFCEPHWGNSYNRNCESPRRNFKWHFWCNFNVTFLIFSLLQKRAKAQFLLEKVFEHLELIEKDFFGLQYADLVPAPDAMVTTTLLVVRRLLSWQPWYPMTTNMSCSCVLLLMVTKQACVFPLSCFFGRSVAIVTSCNDGKVYYNVSLIFFCVHISVVIACPCKGPFSVWSYFFQYWVFLIKLRQISQGTFSHKIHI